MHNVSGVWSQLLIIGMDLRVFARFLWLCLFQSCYPPAHLLETCHWFGRGTSHGGLTVCGDEKQKLLFRCRQGWPWDCGDCAISLTKVCSTPQWCCHGACFFGSTNTTSFSIAENRFHPAVFLYLVRPWFWTFPNFGDLCSKVYFVNGVGFLSASWKIWFIGMEHTFLV